MENKRMKLPPLGTILFLLLLVGVPFIPLIPAHSAGYVGAAGANQVAGYPITAVDTQSPPVTIYSRLEDHDLVTWDTLAHFPYDSPEYEEEINPKLRLKKKKYPLPGFIQRLNGARVAVVGFMIPLEVNIAGDKATSFILARNQSTCCYGIVPKMNEWIFVQMKPGAFADVLMDVPLTVFGTLSVGEEKKQDQAWNLYRMVSDKVLIPKSGGKIIGF